MAEAKDQLKEEAIAVQTEAEEFAVTTAEEMTAAEGMLEKCRKWRKSWLAAVEPTVKSAHATWKEAVKHRDSVQKPVEAAERAIKGKISAYVQEERRKAEAEQRRLQAIEDAKAEKERKRLEKEAEKLKTPELKEARLQEAATVAAPVIVTQAAVPETKLSTVTTWDFEVYDEKAIPREYLSVDMVKIRKVVKALKADATIAGVKVIKKESVR